MLDRHSIEYKSNLDYGEYNYNDAYNYLHKHIRNKNHSVCMTLSEVSLLMCRTLYLSNYEVNSIVGSYLIFWNRNRNVNYVYRLVLEMCFKPLNRRIINHFFIDERINVNDYLLFVCFFSFFSYEDIVTLMISMSGINSKLFISKEQLDLFFVIYDLDKKEFTDMVEVLNFTKPSLPDYPSEAYSLKTFKSYLLKQSPFLFQLYNLQQEISAFTLTKDEIYKINIRRSYYNYATTVRNSLNNYELDYNKHVQDTYARPNESCFEKTIRILFTSKPNPFHYDFSLNYSADAARNEILCNLKQKYCVNKKNTSTCFTTSLFSRSTYSKSNFSKLNIERENKSCLLKNRIIYPATSSSFNNSESLSPAKSKLSNAARIFPEL